MKKMLAFVLALMLAVPALALADGAEITAQGTATVTAAPDQVTVTVGASVTARTVADAREQMDAIVSGVTKKLIELGVAEEDVVTQNYSYYPSYNYESSVRTLEGYQANHTLAVTCRDVEMLDGVIGVATDGGMSEIYNVAYDVADRTTLYRQALALAIEAAGQKADAMAQAGGLTIIGLDELRENGGYDAGVVNAMQDGALYSVRAEASGTGIRSGSVSVTASVTAVYEAGEK